jgi:type IX secretion system PorP/SprF family membrane protein
MKKYILVFVILLVSTITYAQQMVMYSQYMTNGYLINPAMGGKDLDFNLKMGYRNQWVGFEGAPKTYYLSGHTALGLKNDSLSYKGFHGVGGFVYNDRTGPLDRSGVNLSYAYHVPISSTVFASLGAFGGVKQYRLDADRIRLADNSNDLDPVTRAGSQQSFMPDLSIGAYIRSEDFFVGLSLFQVFNQRMFNYEQPQAYMNNRLYQHMFFTAGYAQDITENFTLVPSVLVKYVKGTPLQTDFNLRANYTLNSGGEFKDKVWAGASYRTHDAVVVMAGISFMRNYDLSYAYDITRSDIRKYSAGSHELVVGYRFR